MSLSHSQDNSRLSNENCKGSRREWKIVEPLFHGLSLFLSLFPQTYQSVLFITNLQPVCFLLFSHRHHHHHVPSPQRSLAVLISSFLYPLLWLYPHFLLSISWRCPLICTVFHYCFLFISAFCKTCFSLAFFCRHNMYSLCFEFQNIANL